MIWLNVEGPVDLGPPLLGEGPAVLAPLDVSEIVLEVTGLCRSRFCWRRSRFCWRRSRFSSRSLSRDFPTLEPLEEDVPDRPRVARELSDPCLPRLELRLRDLVAIYQVLPEQLRLVDDLTDHADPEHAVDGRVHVLDAVDLADHVPDGRSEMDDAHPPTSDTEVRKGTSAAHVSPVPGHGPALRFELERGDPDRLRSRAPAVGNGFARRYRLGSLVPGARVGQELTLPGPARCGHTFPPTAPP